MSTQKVIQQSSRHRSGAYTLLAVLLAGGMQPTFAAHVGKSPAFDSTEEAVEALYRAVRSDDRAAISRLLGPLGSSGDMVQDKTDRALFIGKFSEMHRLVREPDGSTVLYIGAENWPFPVPLISDQGRWRFDADAGVKEIMFRRIGENEMTATETCRVITHPDAVTESTAISDYVHKIAGAAVPVSEPFHGYYFRILRSSAGTVVVAYPAAYGVTGVMTFAVAPDGTVYEKDLGRKARVVAPAMMQFKPDPTWHVAEQ